MEVKAVYKYARISAKKMRDVAQEIQGLSVSQATDILSYTPKKGAYLEEKTGRSGKIRPAYACFCRRPSPAAECLFCVMKRCRKRRPPYHHRMAQSRMAAP